MALSTAAVAEEEDDEGEVPEKDGDEEEDGREDGAWALSAPAPERCEKFMGTVVASANGGTPIRTKTKISTGMARILILWCVVIGPGMYMHTHLRQCLPMSTWRTMKAMVLTMAESAT